MHGVGSGGTMHHNNSGCFKDAYENLQENHKIYYILNIDANKIKK